MPAPVLALGKVLGSAALSLLTSLFTEKMMKWLIIWSLEKLVKKTKTQVDDELLKRCKAEWER